MARSDLHQILQRLMVVLVEQLGGSSVLRTLQN
jgi:hypothetical protein